MFEARNTADNHQYAIKKMSCHTKEEEKRARSEIENYQRFSHTNLGLILKYCLFYKSHPISLFLVSLLYHELIQNKPDAHVTCIVWLVFPYFKAKYYFRKPTKNLYFRL